MLRPRAILIIVVRIALFRAFRTRCPGSDNRVLGLMASASTSLFPLVYDQLRRRAGRLMAGERRDHTLQATALVHEAYLKLANAGCSFEGRLHFLNAACLAMRRILASHARERGRQKRVGGRARIAVNDVDPEKTDAFLDESANGLDWLALDEALRKLAELSPRQAQVVQLRFFAGLEDAEIAELLWISGPTVRRDWAAARLWLCKAMQE
jgi:RNA polymerase sigma factor (TIGR02999 family)